ncbi:MAG: hypothetical protein BGO76_00145 [Caedibacter sp. 38-128]|nr:MAG: hypothetical protein BGO76_00145 [Caedibacter sp. 38-128]
MTNKSIKAYASDYSDPELRFELKEKIKKGAKGGKPGEWSARKSQLLKHEYESHGGDYKHKGKKTCSQKSLQQWTSEHWEAADKKNAIRENKTTRYLPHDVWEKLTTKEKQQAINTKEKGSKNRQNVANPSSVLKKLNKHRSR